MRAVLLLLYISTSVPVIRGTLSKTDGVKLNKGQEAEVRALETRSLFLTKEMDTDSLSLTLNLSV